MESAVIASAGGRAPRPPLDAPAAGDAGDVPLVAVVSALLRRRGTILGIAVALAALVAGVTLLGDRTYTSGAKFMTQSRRATPSIAGLASQLGLNLPNGGDGTQAPQFYADLLRSRGILGAVVDSSFAAPVDGRRVVRPLADLLASDVPAGAARRQRAIQRLRDAIFATAGQRTGVIEFTVRMEDAALARRVAERLLAETNRFNLVTRQSQARAEREFTEQRLADVGGQLRDTEARLQRFMAGNRIFGESSPLTLVQGRLERELTLRRQLYQTLAQAYEQARIEEVRDTPVLTIVEAPDEPVRPDPRGLVVRTLLAGVLGLVLGTIPVLLGVFLGSGTRGSDAYAEFAALRREAWLDVTRPWRPVARLARRRRRTSRNDGARVA